MAKSAAKNAVKKIGEKRGEDNLRRKLIEKMLLQGRSFEEIKNLLEVNDEAILEIAEAKQESEFPVKK